jgi:acetyltransferase-like isoleucine patch superfamily enzyme
MEEREMGYFTQCFENMDEEARESFYKTVLMNDSSEYAAAVRTEYYRSVLRGMGENVKIGAGVKIVNPHLISLGSNVRIRDGVSLIARDGSEIVLRDNARLEDRVYLDTEGAGGFIHVGRSVYIGTGTTLFGHKGLTIGDHTLLAQNITLTPYSHIFEDPDTNIIKQGGHSRHVTIGRDVYVGMGVSILYSGDIGDGSVIGAGSTVVKPIPPYSVAVGCPARVIRKRGKAESPEEKE